MAGFFFGNYDRAGSGIAKDGTPKKGLKLYFEILGVRIWKLFALNLFFTIFCIPVVTVGPALAGMTKVLRNYSIDKNAYVFADFWEGFKKNFGKAFILGIVDIIAYTGIVIGCVMYPVFAKNPGCEYFYVLLAVTVSVGVAFTIMNYYMYLMLVSTKLSMKNIIKNALYLSFLEPKRNILAVFIMLISMFIYYLLISINLQFLFILPLVPAAFIAFTVIFICYPVVQKYVVNPYYEKHPDEINPDLPLASNDPEEVLFEDMGGKEKAIEPAEKRKGSSDGRKNSVKKKGKTIT